MKKVRISLETRARCRTSRGSKWAKTCLTKPDVRTLTNEEEKSTTCLENNIQRHVWKVLETSTATTQTTICATSESRGFSLALARPAVRSHIYPQRRIERSWLTTVRLYRNTDGGQEVKAGSRAGVRLLHWHCASKEAQVISPRERDGTGPVRLEFGPMR